MQANSTTATTITQAQATTTETGPTWTTKQPPTRPHRTRRPATRWTAEDAVYNAEAYKAWLQRLDSDHWQEIYGPHTPVEFARALHDCRYYKNAQQQYDAAGKPARWTARLEEVRQQMRATLKALHFENPKALWREYQWSQYRDPNGYSPDHGAHIAEVDHYLWVAETSRAISLDAIDGGYTSPYNCNVDAAIESSRYHGTPYAITDDGDNVETRRADLTHRLESLQRQQASLPTRIKASTSPALTQKLTARYNTLARQIRQTEDDLAEISDLLGETDDLTPQEWTEKIQRASYQYIGENARYGLTRSTPAAATARPVDVFNYAAEADDAIQNLLDLQRQSQELIAYVESVQATGKALTPTQERMYAEAQDLLPVITASLAAQTARLQA
jgi:hypothetical protein